MKILGIHTIDWLGDDCSKESGVDIWRIWRPLEELKKHTDWQIDYQPTLIYGFEKYKNEKEFTEAEMQKAADNLGSYDIIFTSYHPDPGGAALLEYVQDHYGTKVVMDVDDDMFTVNPHNPFWTVVGDWEVFCMQRMIRTQKYLTTTTQVLKDKFDERNEVGGKVTVLPNYISDSYQHPPIDNGEDVIVGYFGGSSHFVDIHESNVLPALQKIMHKYKNVRFKCVGQPIHYYLPKSRTTVLDAVRGRKWVTDLFPTLNFDISIAPLDSSLFNNGKSDIKWQESTRMGAAFVGSKIGPYATLPEGAALSVENTVSAWYDALEKLVVDAKARKRMVQVAQKALTARRLEDHWVEYKKLFEEAASD